MNLLPPHHGKVDIGGVELQVDLAVQGRLAVLVEVLPDLRSHDSEERSTRSATEKHFVQHIENILKSIGMHCSTESDYH